MPAFRKENTTAHEFGWTTWNTSIPRIRKFPYAEIGTNVGLSGVNLGVGIVDPAMPGTVT